MSIRRRSDETSSREEEEGAERSPKARRLSDGSRASRSTNVSLDGSLSPETDGEDPLTLATPLATPAAAAPAAPAARAASHESDEDTDDADDGDDSEEEDEQPQAPKGKGRRATVPAGEDSGPELAEEEEDDGDGGVELVGGAQGHGGHQEEEEEGEEEEAPQVPKGKGRRLTTDEDSSGPELAEGEEEADDDDDDDDDEVEIVDAPALPAGEGAPQANSSHQAEIDNDDDDDDVVVVDPPLPAPTPTHNQQQYTEDENRPGQLHVEGGENDSDPMDMGDGGEESAAAADAGAATASSGGNREVVTTPAEKTKNGLSEGRIKSKSKGKSKGTKRDDEPWPGVVLKIYVENFMCHRKLSVSLCKHVNFINGRNGSGKSAVLAALQICLGAKAHLTHRARSMADFIRHGWAGDAVVEVTLLNNEHGFNFEEYGESITVRRTIKQPSGGGFELRGSDGQVKSRDRAEIFRMLDELGIQVDNPVAVMDQENSKKFLQGSEADKFNFFKKATQLAPIGNTIEDVEAKIMKMKSGHNAASKQKIKEEAARMMHGCCSAIRKVVETYAAIDLLPHSDELLTQMANLLYYCTTVVCRLESIAIGLQKERDAFKSLENLASEIVEIKEQTVWAIVNVVERKLTHADDDVTRQMALWNAWKDKISNLQEEQKAQAALRGEILRRCEENVAEVERHKERARRRSKELAEAQQPLRQLMSERSSLEEEEREKAEERKSASDELKEAREKAKRSAASEREKTLHDKIQQTEEALEEAEESLKRRGGEEKMLELRGGLSAAEEAANKTKQDFDASNKTVEARKDELRSLDTGGFDPLSALGLHMPGLVCEIRKHVEQFRIPPLGPIGASIQLKDEFKKFRVCIETHIARLLGSFVVSHPEDKTKLLAIMKEFRRTSRGRGFQLPTIIIQSPQPRHGVPQNPQGWLQITQAINVSNDQVFNALVDQGSIEKSCVFASKGEAERACLRGQSGRYERMPHGIFEAYYLTQDGGNCNKFSISDGNIQTRTNVSRGVRRVLGVDANVQKEQARIRVQEAEAILARDREVADKAARTLNAAKAALDQEENARGGLEDQARKLGEEEHRLSIELRTLQAARNDAADPTIELEAAHQAAEQALESVRQDLANTADSIRELSDAVEPKRWAKEDAEKAHKDSTEKATKATEELDAGIAKDQNLARNIDTAKAKAGEAKEKLEDLEAAKNQAEENIRKAVSQANMAMQNYRKQQRKPWDGRRVRDPKGREPDALQAVVAAKEKRYERELGRNNLGGKTEAEVMTQLAKTKAAIHELSSLLDELKRNNLMLTAENEKRLAKLGFFQRFIMATVSFEFNEILQEKGASGRAEFDMKKGTLRLIFQKDASDDTSACRDVRQLSGGEKSYTNLAMLLALGKCHECPFRVMDEFDVFMDADSRNHAMCEILNFAEKHRSRQFILITPQDLSSVTATESCKIFKMKPPRRGDHNQATLDEYSGGGAS